MSIEANLVPDSQTTNPIDEPKRRGSASPWRDWWTGLWQSVAHFCLTGVHRLQAPHECDAINDDGPPRRDVVVPLKLNTNRLILIEAGEQIAADGNIIRGVACVDESVVTGQSALVIREAGRASQVIRGTRVVSGQLLVEVTPRRTKHWPLPTRRDIGSVNLHSDASPAPSRFTTCSSAKLR